MERRLPVLPPKLTELEDRAVLSSSLPHRRSQLLLTSDGKLMVIDMTFLYLLTSWFAYLFTTSTP